MIRKSLIVLVLVGPCLLSDTSSAQRTNGKAISKQVAEHLLVTYLRAQGYDTPNAKLDVEPTTHKDFPDFYLFAVYVDTPQRLVHIGSYAIHKRTGDLWEQLECQRLESSAIAFEQKKIRESSGLSAASLNRIRNDKSLCF